MTTGATRNAQDTTSEGTLFMSFKLSEKTWKPGFTTGHGKKPRERNVTARDQERVLDKIASAKRRLGPPETAPVVNCYEAGREGFWLHRFLEAHGITNHVVDSSAIEVNRRQRRAKSGCGSMPITPFSVSRLPRRKRSVAPCFRPRLIPVSTRFASS